MERSALLSLKRAMKKKKPDFIVKAANFAPRIARRWRKPIGRHSPIRQMIRGKPALVSIGYGSPSELRHLHRSGLEMVLVHTEADLQKIRPQEQGMILARVGERRKLALLQLAQQKKITVFNLKAEEKIKDITDKVALHKQQKQEKKSEKVRKQEEKERRAVVQKKKEEEKKTTAEKEEQERELKEKTLTKRQ